MSKHRPTTPSLAASSYPNFTPHITLASFPSDTTIAALRESIPFGQSVVPVQFSSLLSGETYTRSVYVTVKLSPAIASLHAGIHSALKAEPRTPSFPHMSLFYIADKDAEVRERERVTREIMESSVVLNPKDRGSGITLDCNGTGADLSGQTKLDGFTGSEIWIVRCEGLVEEWQILEKIMLASTTKD